MKFVLLSIILINITLGTLDAACFEGEYEVDGTKTGEAVHLDYTTSSISVDGGNTMLNLHYKVPSMYFEGDETIDSTAYQRGIRISYHNRSMDTPAHEACYTNLGSDTVCPSVVQTWTDTRDDNSDCETDLVGNLPFDDLMRNDYHDSSYINVQTGSRTDPDGVGSPYTYDTWVVYMVTQVETWTPYSVQYNTSSEGNDLKQVGSRPSYYYIPFTVEFPQTIELQQGAENVTYSGGNLTYYPSILSEEVTIGTTMLVLYAITDQRTLDINFNPDTNVFSTATLVIKTQVGYPFGLIHYDDENGGVLTSLGSNVNTAVFTFGTNYTQCADDGISQDQFCVQEWHIDITPNECDISGAFEMAFYTQCFDETYGCALDGNQGQTDSNSYTGIMGFSISAQSFCPKLLDTIEVQGNAEKYAANTFDIADVAVPGTNLFVNDDVFVKLDFKTLSTKFQESGATWATAELDGTLIESIRLYQMDLTVVMPAAPLQFTVDQTSTDVTVTDELNYKIVLCTATPLDFPYSSIPDNCLDHAQQGHNARTYMDLTDMSSNAGIASNEVGFKLRLDERVIPVDLPNDGASLAFDFYVEVYYNGVVNPARRRLRRTLNTNDPEVRYSSVRDSYTLPSRREYEWCDLRPSVADVGFVLDIQMTTTDIPGLWEGESHVRDQRYAMFTYLKAQMGNVKYYRAEVCTANEICTLIYPKDAIQNVEVELKYTFVRYYLDVSRQYAQVLQNDLFNQDLSLLRTNILQGKILQTYGVDQCSDETIQNYFTEQRNRLDIDVVREESSSTLLYSAALSMALMFVLL